MRPPGPEKGDVVAKRYEFHSTLPPQAVLVCVTLRAGERGWERLLGETRGDRFELLDAASVQIYGQIPFTGRITPEGTGSRIEGGFYLRAILSWKRLLFFWLAAVAAGLMVSVPFVFIAPAATLWLALSVGLIVYVNGTVFAKRRRRVLDFIEKNLPS